MTLPLLKPDDNVLPTTNPDDANRKDKPDILLH